MSVSHGEGEKSQRILCYNTHEKHHSSTFMLPMEGKLGDDSDEDVEREKESETESTMHFMAYY